MAKASKMCNASPFDAELNYEKGVFLKIPAFGSVDLTLNQMDDYRPDKPGSETALDEPEYKGLFLLDTDRPYENQALEALRKSRDKKRTRYRETTQGHRDRAASQNITLTEENFKSEVLESKKPVLVDFWAEWCGPCRIIAPSIEELANEYEGRAIIGKLNVDEQTNIAGQYGIRSIPTLLFFQNGEVVDQVVGAVPKGAIEDKLKNLVPAA